MKTEWIPKVAGCFLCLLFTLFLCSQVSAQVQVYPGHPRLIIGGYRGLTDSDLQNRCGDASLSAQCLSIGSNGNLLDLAMDWRLHGTPAAADSVVQTLLAGLTCGDGYESTEAGGYALAYDWVYDYALFTPAQKAQVETTLADCCVNIATSLAGNSPHLWHGFSSQAAALALAALSLDTDPRRDQALADAALYFRQRSAEAYRYIDGAWPEGISYERTHFFSGDPPYQYVIDALRAWHSAVQQDHPAHADIFDTIRLEEGDWLRRLGIFHIYATLPPYGAQTKNTWLRHGDIPTGQINPNKQYRPYLDAIASAYGIGELQWLGQQTQADWGFVSGTGSYHSIHRYGIPLNIDPALPAAPPDSLPLDVLFGRPTIGYAFLRSGWEATPRLISFRAGDWFTGHQHMDQGHFEIWYQGPLAVDSGVYANWGTEHREAYYIRTIAHNSILVLRPGETFASAYGFGDVNDGGQRVHTYVGGAQTIQSVAEYESNINAGRHYEAGDIRAFTTEQDFAHVSGDITPAYNSDRYAWGGNTAKVSSVERSLTYFRPEILAICDRVRTKDPSYETAWTLHSTVKPSTPTETLVAGLADDGILESTDGEFTIDNTTGGKLFAKLLYPPGAVVTKVGGASYKYYVDGTNRTAGAAGIEGIPAEPGLWRVEVCDPASTLDHIFLQVFEISDSSQGAMTGVVAVGMIQGDMVGAHVLSTPRNRVALFGSKPAAAPVPAPIQYSLSPTAETLHVLADLEPQHSYRVTTPDGVIIKSSDAEGVLFFIVQATGNQTILIEDGGCPAVLQAVRPLRLVSDPSGFASIGWDPASDAQDGYHVYSVGSAPDIPIAPAAGTLLCDVPQAPSPACTDSNPLAEPPGTLRFYQVVGVCGANEGPV